MPPPTWRKPIWSEGILVSQHHFQAQDRYHEGALRDRLSALRRYDWGIWDLEIDETLIPSGQFGLRRLFAVWPDGLIVRSGGSSANPPPGSRSFDAYFRAEESTLDVFAAVTVEGVSNVPAPNEAAGLQRFSRVAAAADDFNTGGSPQDIEFAVPNVRIVFGGERSERASTLPVAQLVRQADGKILVRDTFVPPVLGIGAAPFLTAGVRRVLGAMGARQRDLMALRKQRTVHDVEFHGTDARRFWLLHTLNSSIPILSHLLETEQAHPEEIYLALARLAGELGTFSAEADVASIPRFNYVKLGEVFEVLFARVLALLAVDSAAAYTEVALERRVDGMFVGKIAEPRLTNQEFFVAARSSLPESVLRERIPQLLKIASWQHIAEVVKQARHGVRTEVEWSPSSSLPVKPDLCFFRMRREGSFWEEIAKTRTIALYLPKDGDWKDTWLAVYAIDPVHLR